ncbi:DUF1772-domain-containing protein [Dacryopinax primogenitus]|uniref:DUF1772-domain-containing protein n=1 Tax=Dacryopinax primogenitus (strain DJM 731) TaxID=1858805 RepID=M5G3J8_DACPD|nr:DUF1772-domain-containing protein [Dacryopinax primogenitus]EJT98332.1 DUF1772-domain-containing protein [Dacryopinax primogenitus]
MSFELVPFLQVFAIAGAAFLSGYITTFSVGIPHIALAPPLLAARQWEDFYDRGKLSAPFIGLFFSLLFVYISYSLGGPFTSSLAALYALAGAATVGIIPWTLGTMLPMNTRLQAYAAMKESEVQGEKAEKSAQQEVRRLFAAWTILNSVRAMWPALGAALAGWALLGW